MVPGFSEAPSRRLVAAVGVFVTFLALVRMLPAELAFEEQAEFWDPLVRSHPAAYLLDPWAGYLQVWARLVFLIAFPFGNLGPLVTRAFAASVIGGVAILVCQSPALGSPRVRIALALALPLFPIPYPGPYVGPLNSQWWLTIAAGCLALGPPRRWHMFALVAAGISGIAPCLAVPVFRDRRVVALIGTSVLQGSILLTSDRRPAGGAALGDGFATLAIVLALLLIAAPLALRTRLVFAYLGLVVLALGSIATVPGDHTERYQTLAWFAILLAGLAIAEAAIGRARRVQAP